MSTIREQCQRKNEYFLRTMQSEIPTFDVISFDVFDTLLLRGVLFPHDIFKLLAARSLERFSIVDFHYIRINVEAETRTRSGNQNISLDQIYTEISHRYPELPINALKEIELKLEIEYIRPNPLAQKLFALAKEAKKRIWIITDMCLPEDVIEHLLRQCGYDAYEHLYISGQIQKAKETGSLYRTILEETGVAPNTWLHIGDNGHSDINVPRRLGITAGFLRCPRDWYFMERNHQHQKAEELAGQTLLQEDLDDSLAFSQKTAEEINITYTTCIPLEIEIIITADRVAMMFNMSTEKVDNFKEYVVRFLKRQLSFQEFWALKDVCFSVRRGEKVGLVGLNGSGKSTMLKVVSGVLKPTKGKMSVSGSVAPLIELGAGFDFELSARENVFLNGAILGYNHAHMLKYYQQIIDFSELHDFEDVAIKNFSSGMIARLGFAIATCYVPDILIIDEILSVGDFEFQKKCHKKMEELTGHGATVLFVSHSAADIINMCDRAIWLHHGEVVADGEAQYIVEKYLNC